MNRALLVVGCLLLLSACSFFSNAPESRATQFLKVLVTDPGDAQQLRGLADVPEGADPQSVVHGVSTQVALDYLRTLQRQGQRQDFGIGPVRVHGASGREVTVLVTPNNQPAVRRSAIRFHVELKDVATRGWLVTAVQAE